MNTRQALWLAVASLALAAGCQKDHDDTAAVNTQRLAPERTESGRVINPGQSNPSAKPSPAPSGSMETGGASGQTGRVGVRPGDAGMPTTVPSTMPAPAPATPVR
ncbi:MAG TPA: hypothetical protein VIL86_00330 [Tepidisphaeraceae bacterium]|jgi:hypothetical protein